MTKNFSADATLDEAFSPRPPSPVPFYTRRSGLPVSISLVGRDKSGTPSVKVALSGSVDEYDARQLARFFDMLAPRLSNSK